MQPHKIVSREEWIAARKAHLAHEKEFTRARDRLSEERRALPWVKVDKTYVFDGPDGKQTLADLFAGRSQLVVQHFMFAPDWNEGCKSCSFWADGFERMIPHLAARDTTLVAVSRAPLAKARGVQGADGLDVRLVVLRRQRLQLRLRGFVYAGGDQVGRQDLQFRNHRLRHRGRARHQRVLSATRPATSSTPIPASRAAST